MCGVKLVNHKMTKTLFKVRAVSRQRLTNKFDTKEICKLQLLTYHTFIEHTVSLCKNVLLFDVVDIFITFDKSSVCDYQGRRLQ